MRALLTTYNLSLEMQDLFAHVVIILKHYGKGPILTLATRKPEVSQTITHMSFTLSPPGGRQYVVPARLAYAKNYYVTFHDLADPFSQRAVTMALLKMTRDVLHGFCPTMHACVHRRQSPRHCCLANVSPFAR
ncbi:hypothetical protein SPRG_15785 [Saprolegnia parasitica CBS 223.65]|uniref:Uncharacterized protein n=1 Tax=Saprolegnia parasitica (strain CBS 223.65) TaxID=695850 RepID=A0A067BKX2_SAPPC|nr:hypothetical protein SPRG_15785 [Saprolegnia parasitica CBS 223.65]KDO18838.1 hypothetical protein SPRG_15785 [Saprolegnia parasitica CBS 223.65]|eukprot:XP_012210451.1 hypothetical protein SPRG_15785 [Saprolegnia parasitica CBS 223.65]